MAFKFNNSNKSNDDGAKFDIAKYGAEARNPRQIGDNCITFTLKCDGFSLYNMRLIEGKSGKRFITPPATKSNGNYYNQYAIYLSDSDEQMLIDTIMQLMESGGNAGR